ncbi:hypothetical protein TNIN_104741 [Trichonephila inaurata madagascariensis]|uniref:Uncharacterized protein n=1 Tax=Trichonephila inaurata madagascariensis TaxID=2747483 RepID=A0A8X7BYU4_9ARAC|nr:hypothetical protein TNIN_104741 [Trichonephila inaurata madagascariensis]
MSPKYPSYFRSHPGLPALTPESSTSSTLCQSATVGSVERPSSGSTTKGVTSVFLSPTTLLHLHRLCLILFSGNISIALSRNSWNLPPMGAQIQGLIPEASPSTPHLRPSCAMKNTPTPHLLSMPVLRKEIYTQSGPVAHICREPP